MTPKRPTKPNVAVDIRDEEDPFVGGVPNSVLDSEAAFLSACLMHPENFAITGYMLEPRQFYSTANQHVLEAMRALYLVSADDGAKYEADVVLVANYMRDHGTLKQSGGSPYVAQLLDCTPATANPGQHAAAIKEAWRRRELMTCMRRLATLLRGGEASHADCYEELRNHFRETKNG